MALTTNLEFETTPDVKTAAAMLVTSGRVHVIDWGTDYVQSIVSDKYENDVLLERSGSEIAIHCSCRWFEENCLACAHIWATLLAAEKDGLLASKAGSDPDILVVTSEDEFISADDRAFDHDQDDEMGNAAFPPTLRLPTPSRPVPAPKPPKEPPWKSLFKELQGAASTPAYSSSRDAWPVGCELLYLLDFQASLIAKALILEVSSRERKKNGEWSKPKPRRLLAQQIPHLPDPADRRIIELLARARPELAGYYGYQDHYASHAGRYTLKAGLTQTVLPMMCATGRCLLRRLPDSTLLPVIRCDGGPPWDFLVTVVPDADGKNYLITGTFQRGEATLALTEPTLFVADGFIFHEDRAARLNDNAALPWINPLHRRGTVAVPIQQGEALVAELAATPHRPKLALPEELRFDEAVVAPRPSLKVKAPASQNRYGNNRLRCELTFDYAGKVIPHQDPGHGVFQKEERRLLLRDRAAEERAQALIRQLGCKPGHWPEPHEFTLAPRNLPKLVRRLIQEQWHVEADGKLYRQPGDIKIEVSSGIDWFELHGTVQFGDAEAKLPELLAALNRGESTVQLGDGTFGLLPEEWLKKYGPLAGLGKAEDGHLRFTRSQVGLLDALLAAQPQAACDAVFSKARDELRAFQGIEPADPPAGFQGELRAYQRDGLGWLQFLQRFGFGGCLADDMGLGKTVQVLALLESRRELRATAKKKERPGPALVVMPRSLVFNWRQEAARFAPQLRVLDHSGITRAKSIDHFQDFDVILTTYGILRRDALQFKDAHFDYCNLDEAQAIKNASTESAKAARLLRAEHRLVLSGTPIENHLGELWSLFEFLNPGMLGSASVLRLGGVGARNPDEETRRLLASALRPFILRRTKQQVAKDLPEKTEQTLFCDLEPAQRKQYDELRAHYRKALLEKVQRDGLNKAKIMVLEALLRLRQAACHPGLIDKKLAKESSAKLDLLLPQLAEVSDEGHKVLVFSQFTSLLAIVKQRLTQEKIPFEYLDGQTRDRAAPVERFQTDPNCKVFLISLKAGGLGLNLTAAEYVYLLDPWWNPAVEAQAIDRAHRIGQTQPVFAYRIIARDTVEEKVLELQKNKRHLADAIINADNSLIRDLAREDLELLLS